MDQTKWDTYREMLKQHILRGRQHGWPRTKVLADLLKQFDRDVTGGRTQHVWADQAIHELMDAIWPQLGGGSDDSDGRSRFVGGMGRF